MSKKSLEERIQRMEDIHEIKNLMGRLEFLHTAGEEKEAMEFHFHLTNDNGNFGNDRENKFNHQTLLKKENKTYNLKFPLENQQKKD